MSDRLRTFVNRMLARDGGGAAPPGGALLQVGSDNFAGLTTTTAIDPVYTAFPLSVALTTGASKLHIYAYVAWNLTGTPVGTVRAANFRFLLNGTPLGASRATSWATAQGQIATNSFTRVVDVAAGLQTVTMEWAKQAGSGTLQVNTTAGILPDVFGAQLVVQEVAP